MTPRQSTLLKHLIETHIETAEPVASALLASSIEVSSATVRNDLAELEEKGFIQQPHTSAGRIPTVKGYEFYLQSCFNPQKPTTTQQAKIKKSLGTDNPVKSIAKELAEETHLAVMVALANNNFYYTGLSQLFAQPEFRSQHDQVINISAVLDRLDEMLRDLFETADAEIQILIGENNPFSSQTSLLLMKGNVAKKQEGVVGVLGPSRVDYNRVSGLLDYAKMTLNKHYS